MQRFFTVLASIEFFSSVLLGAYSLIFGEFNKDNWFLMIAIGLFVAAGFTFLIGLFSGMFLEKR